MTSAHDIYCVILAGGSGTRFWPRSRQKRPKQLCQIGDSEKTMLELTLERIEQWIPRQRRLIVTHHEQFRATQALVGQQVAAILAEPEAKNTAAALTLAAAWVDQDFARREPGSPRQRSPIMISLHADQLIADKDAFLGVLSQAVMSARTGRITLIGIKPTRAETGFGYIETDGEAPDLPGILEVASFIEKPDLQKAERLAGDGRHYWNSGLFIWSTSVLTDALAKHAPALHAFHRAASALDFRDGNAEDGRLAEMYASLTSISIDHALLEKTAGIRCVPGDFGWHDIGSWSSLRSCFNTDGSGNYLKGDVMVIDSKDCTIDGNSKQMIAAIGLTGIVIVVEDDAVLVCRQEEAQQVKEIVAQLKRSGRKDLT